MKLTNTAASVKPKPLYISTYPNWVIEIKEGTFH